ncbi:MAG: biliverdin-producing heme oxygenase [Phycisphaerales bacterium JB060]
MQHPTTHTGQAEASTGFAATLKDSTWDLHQQAESGELQKRLVKGELGRHEYAAHLGQLYLVHRTLERCLDAADCAQVRALNGEDLHHTGKLEADLAHLSVDPADVQPVPATESFTGWIEDTARDHPTALIGVQYVLEGSTNGNGYIAKKIGPALGLEEDGVRYLKSYGPAQRETWGRFKSRLDTLDLSEASRERVVEAARRTFEGVRDIHRELLEVLAGHTKPAGA